MDSRAIVNKTIEAGLLPQKQSMKAEVKQSVVAAQRVQKTPVSSRPSNLPQTCQIVFEPLKMRCPFCPNTFAKTQDLYAHIRTHQNHMTCPYCTKKSNCMGMFVCHVRTHTGEKPYACPVRGCEFASASKCNLKIHLSSNIHGGSECLIKYGDVLDLDVRTKAGSKRKRWKEKMIIKMKKQEAMAQRGVYVQPRTVTRPQKKTKYAKVEPAMQQQQQPMGDYMMGMGNLNGLMQDQGQMQALQMQNLAMHMQQLYSMGVTKQENVTTAPIINELQSPQHEEYSLSEIFKQNPLAFQEAVEQNPQAFALAMQAQPDAFNFINRTQ